MMIALLSLLLAAASSEPAPTQKPIVVTGHAIQEKKSGLRDCLARGCSPDEDIDATLALAETQLLAGKYDDARATLLQSLGRNKKFAAAYPIPVSDLYRANGRVAAHLGIDSDYYRSTWGIYTTLKKGLPSEVDRHYSAMMEVAEMMATTRGHDRAREYYRSIAHNARADGRPDIAALAELRSIMRHWPAYAREKAIREIADSKDPKTQAAQLEARLALARIAFERNEVSKGEAVVGELKDFGIRKPILIYAPPWAALSGPASNDPTHAMENQKDTLGFASDAGGAAFNAAALASAQNGRPVDPTSVRSSFGGRALTATRMPLSVRDMWVDVGFHITPEGKVSDVQVLRSRGNLYWTKSLLASIAGRRYTAPADGPVYRAERYTYTSGLEAGTGRHALQHSPLARVEYIDLTDLAAPN